MMFNYDTAKANLSREYSDEEIILKFREMGFSAIQKNDSRIFGLLGRRSLAKFNEEDEFHMMIKSCLSDIPSNEGIGEQTNSKDLDLSDKSQKVESSLTVHPVRISSNDTEALNAIDEAIEKYNRECDS